MTIKLAGICHDLRTNTIEGTWFDEVVDENGNTVSLTRVKCRNYSKEQKAEFVADCGVDGALAEVHATIAGW